MLGESLTDLTQTSEMYLVSVNEKTLSRTVTVTVTSCKTKTKPRRDSVHEINVITGTNFHLQINSFFISCTPGVYAIEATFHKF